MKPTALVSIVLLFASTSVAVDAASSPRGVASTQPTATQPTTQPAETAEVDASGPLALTIARAYGFDRWGEVDVVSFTFNAAGKGPDAMRRHWTWDPRSSSIKLSHDGAGDLHWVLYYRDLLSDPGYQERFTNTDRQFINDSYWLLFPFHLVWSNPHLEDKGMAPLPIGEGEGQRVTVTYPAEGGYTPGDVYELYLDPETRRILQWVFKRGGKGKGSAMTWEGERQIGPILISTEHRNKDGELQLWFSDVQVAELEAEGDQAEPERF